MSNDMRSADSVADNSREHSVVKILASAIFMPESVCACWAYDDESCPTCVSAAESAIQALRELPTEQLMEAMGMRRADPFGAGHGLRCDAHGGRPCDCTARDRHYWMGGPMTGVTSPSDARTSPVGTQPTLFDTPRTASHLAAGGACTPPASRTAATPGVPAGRCEPPSRPATGAAAPPSSSLHLEDVVGLDVPDARLADASGAVHVAGDLTGRRETVGHRVRTDLPNLESRAGKSDLVAAAEVVGGLGRRGHAIIKPRTRRSVNHKSVDDSSLSGYRRTEAEHPELRELRTFSAAWYARWRDLHLVKYPDLDASSRSNLDMFIRIAEDRERAATSASTEADE